MAEDQRNIGTWNYQDGLVTGQSSSDYLGEFITGSTCVLAAGPPVYGDGEVGNYIVIGVTQSVSLSQQKSVQRILEVGSRDNIIVPGTSGGALQLSRVWYSGPSLMKALYQDYVDNNDEEIEELWTQPGYGDVFLNLASGLFDAPIGLVLAFTKQANTVTEGDSEYESEHVGRIFLENCYITNHAVAMQAGAVVLAEQVGVQYERMHPVDLTSVS